MNVWVRWLFHSIRTLAESLIEDQLGAGDYCGLANRAKGPVKRNGMVSRCQFTIGIIGSPVGSSSRKHGK